MGDSVIVEQHIPCPCGTSSDAYCVYDDGHGHCYSCNKTFQPEKSVDNDAEQYTFQYVPWGKISQETMAFADVKAKVNSQGVPVSIGFNYGGRYLVRPFEGKAFQWAPKTNGNKGSTLFLKDKFPPGSGRYITIVEGGKDALAVLEMFGCKYPVVSVRSAGSARADCAEERDYLNSFERIYLCLDNDDPGQKATRDVASLFDFNKVYHVKIARKDAYECLENGEVDAFKRSWFNSNKFLPEGIVSSYSSFDRIIDEAEHKTGFPLPFNKLSEMLGGLVTGKSYLFTALEGVGKTELIRAIEYKLLKETDDNIGVIHIEEPKDEQLLRLAGQELRLPVHLHDTPVSRDEIKAALRSATKRDERLHLYSHFGSDDPNVIIDTIRFLVAACGCKYIFLDHITMVVSGLMGDDERKQLDYLSTRLEMMVKELDFCLVFISHVNDDGLTRGSRNISKVADKWVHLHRDLKTADEQERNRTYLIVNKNRGRHQTGPAGVLTFDPETYTLNELNPGELPV